MAGKQKSGKNPDWTEAQKFCRMTDEAIAMAKELGLTPRTLTSNHSSTHSEKWKTSTEDWVRHLYEKRRLEAAQKAKRNEKAAKAAEAGNTSSGSN